MKHEHGKAPFSLSALLCTPDKAAMRGFAWLIPLLLCLPVAAQQIEPDQLSAGSHGLVLSVVDGISAWSVPGVLPLRGRMLTGAMKAPITSRVVNAALQPGGSDIGAKVKLSIASLAGSCGTIVIPPGSYTWSINDVVMDTCQLLDAYGAVINVASTVQTALVVATTIKNEPDPTVFAVGGVRGATFMGGFYDTGTKTTATRTAIFVGGDQTGVLTPPHDFADLSSFTDVHISGFNIGYMLGNHTQVSWFNGGSENNNVGVEMQPGVSQSSENDNMHGFQILNNFNYGIYSPDFHGFATFDCYGCSIDYNGDKILTGREVSLQNGEFHMFGGHIEGKQMPFIDLPTPSYPTSVVIALDQVGLNFVDTTRTDTGIGYIHDKALNANITIGPGNEFLSQGAKVAAIVNFAQIPNGLTTFYAQPYIYQANTGASLPAYVGIAPNSYSYPVEQNNGIVLEYVQSFGSSPSSPTVGRGITPNGIDSLSIVDANPPAVDPQSCTDQTVAVPGLRAGERLTAPTLAGSLGNSITVLTYTEAGTAGKMIFHFCNVSTGSATPPALRYSWLGFR
jgi:hypothetical protein